MYPTISILLPTYNAGQSLALSVESIINQNYKKWTLLVLDDGSSDNSLKMLSHLNDKRIKIIKNKFNKGISYRLNQGIKLSKTKYIARMDSDDISFPDRLEKQFNFLEKNKEIDLVSSKAVIFFDNKYQLKGLLPHKKSHTRITQSPWKTILMPHPTWMGRTEWFKKNLYKIPAVRLAEDQELLLRSMTFSKFHSLPNILLAYRVSKFDFFKNLLSRISLLKLHFHFFFCRKKIKFLIFAINLFILKLLIDLMRLLLTFLKIDLTKNYRKNNLVKTNNNFINLIKFLKKKAKVE